MWQKFIDAVFGSHTRLSYRRLTCWIVCTVFVASGHISGEDYVAVCLMFIGSDSAAKAIGAWRGGSL